MSSATTTYQLNVNQLFPPQGMQISNPHVEAERTLKEDFGPRVDHYEAIPEKKIVTAEDFPSQLIELVGKEKFAKMSQIQVIENDTGYMDECFSVAMMPDEGMVIGTDQYNRVFFSFLVENKVGRQEVITIFQRRKNEDQFNHRTIYSPSTIDKRLLDGNVLEKVKYEALGEIFSEKHVDLKLATKEKTEEKTSELLDTTGKV